MVLGHEHLLGTTTEYIWLVIKGKIMLLKISTEVDWNLKSDQKIKNGV